MSEGKALPTAEDLLGTIRTTVRSWAEAYAAHSGHTVEPMYVSSLANDIAFEFGILEAIDRAKATTVIAIKEGGVDE